MQARKKVRYHREPSQSSLGSGCTGAGCNHAETALNSHEIEVMSTLPVEDACKVLLFIRASARVTCLREHAVPLQIGLDWDLTVWARKPRLLCSYG